jgi:ATP-dependent RNA helicase DHX8/PRP22
MEDLKNLEYLSLVSKICTELDNHLGINDKDLAEFIIHMAQENDTYDAFRTELNNNQADFPDSFSSNLYRIVQKMLPTPMKKSNVDNGNGTASDQSRQLADVELRKAICPVLCKPNDTAVRVKHRTCSSNDGRHIDYVSVFR